GERSCKKTTVEECWCLDARRLARQDVILRHGFSGSLLTWTNRWGERTLTVTYGLETAAGGARIVYLRSRLEPDGNQSAVGEPILLVTTRPHFGGLRWWFLCPLVVNGVA